MKYFLTATIGILIFGMSSCTTTDKNPDEQSDRVDFVSEIKPIFQERCVNCHNKETLPKRTSFESKDRVMAGDQSGPVIVPGDPDASRLMAALRVPDFHHIAMPPVSHRVTKEEIELISRWIKEGAEWPEGEEGKIVPTEKVLE